MDLWNYYDGDLKYPDLNNHSHEKEIAKTNPKWAFEYASEHGRDKELEPIIAKSAAYSFKYTYEILHNKPFPLGEPAIAKKEYCSVLYAQHVLYDRFELAEPTIAKNTKYSKEYTQEVLMKDFILDGKLICKYEG